MKQIFIKAVLLFATVISATKTIAQPCKEIIGYYPNWQWYDRTKLVKPSSINYSKYSIINYSFFKPESSGLISNTDSWADENLLQGQINWSTNPVSYYPNTSIIDLAHNAGTKVMVSIGGWTLSDYFPTIAANAAKRALFASECNRLIKKYNFDGIDIDWEYPGFAEHAGTSADKQNFTLLLQQIKDSITVLGNANGKTYLLSACFSADPAKADDIEWNNVVTILDMVNLMSYDFFGAWDCVANHNSPLFTGNTGDPSFNINSAFNLLTNTYQVPAGKINIGVAFYGRTQTGATNIYQSTNCAVDNNNFMVDEGSPTYYNIVNKFNLFNYYWDNTAKVPYLLGKTGTSASGTFVSFDDKKSIALKAEYIKNNNARGTIIWEITGDYIETSPGSGIVESTPLVDTLNYVFCHSTVTNIEDAARVYVGIYPNPSSGIFNIYVNEKNASIKIYDLEGKLIVLKETFQNNTEINLQDFPAGIYILKVSSAKGSYYEKLLKE